jgi:hypothetical protein
MPFQSLLEAGNAFSKFLFVPQKRKRSAKKFDKYAPREARQGLSNAIIFEIVSPVTSSSKNDCMLIFDEICKKSEKLT